MFFLPPTRLCIRINQCIYNRERCTVGKTVPFDDFKFKKPAAVQIFRLDQGGDRQFRLEQSSGDPLCKFPLWPITVGAFESGSVGNIIPDHAILRGTIRSYQPAVREKLLSGVRRTALAAAASAAAPEPTIHMGTGTGSVINSESVIHSAVAALKSAFGESRVVQIPAIGASEDFSEFSGAGIPSMFFFVGGLDPQAIAAASRPGGRGVIANHSPYFAPLPEPSITTAVRAMSVAVMNAMPLAPR